MAAVKLIIFLYLIVLATAYPQPDESAQVTDPKEDICKLPPTSLGKITCMGFAEMWTFNSTSARCEQVIYGGCGRTANLFRTEQQCQSLCPSQSEPALSPCRMPKASGRCRAIIFKYYFDEATSTCQQFVFTGCGGNDNRFDSMADCERMCPTLPESETASGIILTLPEEDELIKSEGNDTCTEAVCSKSNDYYLDKGCKPIYQPNSCCPSRYNCPDEETKSRQCFYRGLSYEIDQPVPVMVEDERNNCQTDCVCRRDLLTNRTAITCKKVQCPPTPAPVGSESSEEHIPEAVDDSSEEQNVDESSEEKTEGNLCHANGISYRKGQQMPTANPCRSCICDERFDDVKGPYCYQLNCFYQPPGDDCVPIFDDILCCPTSYKCASEDNNGTNIVIPFENETFVIESDPEFESISVHIEPNVCLQAKEKGPCEAMIKSYYYNKNSDTCEVFWYGGCHGNGNRFGEINQCRAHCIDTEEPTKLHISPRLERLPSADPPQTQDFSVPDDCKLAPSRGPCRGFSPRYYYNETAGQCQTFNYGGCQGNSNNFKTSEECAKTCMAANIKPEPSIILIKSEQLSPEPQCTFGNLTLNLGDRLESAEPCVCSTPPEITCNVAVPNRSELLLFEVTLY